ncbi:MAG: pilus assembly protein PilM [Planctomycetota bacterium]
MARTATGIDIGTSTVKLLRGEVKGTSFVVTDFFVAPNPGGTTASGWEMMAPGLKPKACRLGLTGREVNVRYSRVPRVPDWQLRKLMRFEAAEIGGQSDSAVASDFNVLPEIPEIEGEDVVMLCMARESLLAQHAAGLAAIGGELDAFTPNAVALYNAFLHYGVVMEDTVLVANVGRENIDVVLVRGTDLLLARNLSGGSRLFDEAIAQRFQIDERRAERFKIDEGTVAPGAAFRSANQEKASRAMLGPAGQLLSLLQSAVLFAKNQVKLSTLKLDRVLLCGGGAALEGLTGYLANALGVKVELFDPFVVVDTTKLDPARAAALDEHRLEAVLALGLATSASDPAAYSIEILPAAVAKRREFQRGPAFLIALAALALAFLGVKVWRMRGDLAELRETAAALESRLARARRNDGNTRALLAESEALAARARELHALAGSGEEIVRAVAAIERHLPQDFWLDSLTSSWSASDDLGVRSPDLLPILRLRGQTREGTDAPTVLFEEFVEAVRKDLPPATRLVHQMASTGSYFTLELTCLLPPAPAVEAEAAAEEGPGPGGREG